jgi:Pectate lyase superfamily protein
MFHLFKRANTAVPSASVGKVRLFVDTDGIPKVKNETGTLTSLGGVSTQTNSGASSTALTLNFTQGLSASSASGVSTIKSSRSFQGFFDVTEYGAKGDNTQDDTSFINAAIAAAVAYNAGASGAAGQRGATIYFPAGVYKVTSALTSPNSSGIVFKGESIGASTIACCICSRRFDYICFW